MFPQWEYIECPRTIDICATDIRAIYFDPNISVDRFDKIEQHVSPQTHEFLKDFRSKDSTREHAFRLASEFDHIRKYRKAWEAAPYAPTFVTVDAVVVQAGHILLIKRKSAPGKGLFAMPGGFLNPGERIINGMLRELDEETKIKVQQKVLRGSVVGKEVYDFPGRSLRGRVITHAFAIQLPESKLSKVKGSDDAEKAFWVPINEVYKMQDMFFEDHWYVIDDMLTRFIRT
jgi:bifunctional NMN adenylyltransferase/nudix hydrolase